MPLARHSHRVVAVAYQGLAAFEFGIATEMFGLPRPEFANWYQFRACSCDTPMVRATAGLFVTTHGGLGLLRQADTIIIPGWCGVDQSAPRPLLRALQRAHERGVRILSFCSGAFVLAEAGLLDGRRATTHWRYAEQLAARFPLVEVDSNVLYLQSENIFTSAGSSAAIDLSLYVIHLDHGADVANSVARRLVVPPHREGGQAQFVAPAWEDAARPVPIQGLVTWLEQHLHLDHSVEALARRARMSPRTFARRFREATGTTPHRWLVRQRIFAAQRLLEASDASIEEITTRCGLGTTANLRHHFSHWVGVSPSSYRASFRGLHFTEQSLEAVRFGTPSRSTGAR